MDIENKHVLGTDQSLHFNSCQGLGIRRRILTDMNQLIKLRLLDMQPLNRSKLGNSIIDVYLRVSNSEP
jgi:hypothetical protein